MKKILVITHAGGSPYHGPNMRWYYLGQALRSKGVQVEIVSSSSFHKYINPPQIVEPLVAQKIDVITYYWLKTRSYAARGVSQVGNQLEFVYRCYRASSFLAKKSPDVVIASSPHPLITFPAKFIARKAGARFMFEVRDLWPEVLLEIGKFSRVHPYMMALKIAEWYGVKSAERVISVKPGDKEYFLERFGVTDERFSYLPNGFLPMSSEGDAPEKVKKLRSRYSFMLGYVGALSAYYRLEDLLGLARLFKDRPDIGFVVVGKGDRMDSLAKEVADSGLVNVHLIGAIPKMSVPATLAEFDACYVGLEDIDIHRYGISCNKIYEYMAAGKPIIGSYRAGYDPVAEANCGIVVNPGEYQKLANALEKLIGDAALRSEYGSRAYEYFLAHHDFKIVAQSLVQQLFPEGLGSSTEA